MRPTRSGLFVLGASAVLVLAGRVLGLPELFAVSSALGLLVVACGLWVWSRRLDISVTRTVRPHRIHVGNPCTVDVHVRNRHTSRTPVLRVRDPVTGTPGADLLLPPIWPHQNLTVSYRLPTDRRGLRTIGAMRVEITDPFGLARTADVAAPEIEVTVLPHVDDIEPWPRSVGPDPEGVTETGALGRAGEDFSALRPYVPGDDLRRVHWLTSARTDELLVKQHDLPWQGRLCVVVDQRRSASDDAGFERVVSGAASVIRAHLRRGDEVRLVTTDGADSGYGAGAGHLTALLELLAVIERSARGSLTDALEVASRGATGSGIVFSAQPATADLDRVDRLGATFQRRRVVRFDVSARTTTDRGTEIVGVTASESFAAAWSATVSGRRRGLTRRKVRR